MIQGKKRDPDTMRAYEAVMASELAEVDKVKEAFKLVTDFFLLHSEHEIEVLRAMSDRENLVKEQIKASTIRSMQGILADAYRQATGRKAWDE
ncbi:MAG: hypothetical protein H6662_18535 [Ardenticatenaceae bacterium]|nr:hypothetical protein [Anaerolineales bacterium]MCB8923588.1 hypothetical protein [Ardenticatenaceae bacterium]MCB9003528.1 hypothetical protein [Ardenticatenaceae bacterium]